MGGFFESKPSQNLTFLFQMYIISSGISNSDNRFNLIIGEESPGTTRAGDG
jgi:hypothetical protein